ncbi:hypothetical protein BSL78_00481 [Apostichopus japonicus]|uniref:Uncharacterized protein n=1 Tax=Stichopus japonicus TaxID=307972 RepID=A0A2G8LQS8_STIJA|nr:hypothetical protein BSL78_00481 [Apostichopus japonicus]
MRTNVVDVVVHTVEIFCYHPLSSWNHLTFITGEEPFSEEGLCQVYAILSHSFRRLEEEINNCVEACHQLDTELEVSVFGRLEQFLEFCAQRIQRNMLSVTVLSCLSVIFDPNASFNKAEVWSSNATYPKFQEHENITVFTTLDYHSERLFSDSVTRVHIIFFILTTKRYDEYSLVLET